MPRESKLDIKALVAGEPLPGGQRLTGKAEECSMTTEELETKIATLEARIAALELWHAAQNRTWQLCARIAGVGAVVLGLLTMASAILNILEHKTDPLTQVFGCTITVAIFLIFAFTRAAEPANRTGT
jgi:hypothetical protein